MEEKVKLGYRERDKLFKKYFSELKIKVALNWFELIALMAISSFVGFKLLVHYDLSSKMIAVFIAIGISFVLSYFYCNIRKYKLSINRFDKERIYKRVSSELLDAKDSSTK